jgi:hypothetical protein
LEIWQPLAEQGNTDAQVGLGDLYLGGYGVGRKSVPSLLAEAMAAALRHVRYWP